MLTKLLEAEFNLNQAGNFSQKNSVQGSYTRPHKGVLVSFPALCHVYITMNSFLSVRVHAGVMAQELLHVVAERMDVPHGDLLLVAVTYPGGKYTRNP